MTKTLPIIFGFCAYFFFFFPFFCLSENSIPPQSIPDNGDRIPEPHGEKGDWRTAASKDMEILLRMANAKNPKEDHPFPTLLATGDPENFVSVKKELFTRDDKESLRSLVDLIEEEVGARLLQYNSFVRKVINYDKSNRFPHKSESTRETLRKIGSYTKLPFWSACRTFKPVDGKLIAPPFIPPDLQWRGK